MRFLFRPINELWWYPSFNSDDAYMHATKVERLPFHYNAIHDIESAWWVGVWMLFFYKPKGHIESEEKSHNRKLEADLVFPGTLNHSRRLLYLERPMEFFEFTTGWISEKFLPAVGGFDFVRVLLLKHYRHIEENFPDGLSKLSGEGEADHCPHNAFPAGPPEDIYTPIKELFLRMKGRYNNIKLEAFKVSKLEMDDNGLKMNQRMSTQSSGNWKNDDRADEEVGEGKGKKRKWSASGK
jgi:hypothetical protein